MTHAPTIALALTAAIALAAPTAHADEQPPDPTVDRPSTSEPEAEPDSEPEAEPDSEPDAAPEPDAATEPEAAPEPDSPPDAEPELSPETARIQAAVDAKRFGSAVVSCEVVSGNGANDAALSRALKALCAQAYLGLGDKLAGIGSVDEGKKRWRRAAALDPTLLDDAAFLQRMKTGKAPVTSDPLVRPPIPGPDDPPPDKPPEHTPPPDLDPDPPDRDPRATDPVIERPAEPPEPQGPRGGRTFGAGLGGGFDGLLSIVLSVIKDELVSVELSFGFIFRTLDTRIRLHGFKEVVTPVFGLGMTTPFGRGARFGVELDSYDDLYKLGHTLHLDFGLSWAVTKNLEIFGGAAFLTTLDQEHPDRLVFFPQGAIQTLWYF